MNIYQREDITRLTKRPRTFLATVSSAHLTLSSAPSFLINDATMRAGRGLVIADSRPHRRHQKKCSDLIRQKWGHPHLRRTTTLTKKPLQSGRPEQTGAVQKKPRHPGRFTMWARSRPSGTPFPLHRLLPLHPFPPPTFFCGKFWLCY